jgi:formate hydrogenlyase subunit 3/multisubunit Na+/H+ antiporter MnhD subunit
MIVFAVKAALFPVQFWLPATYANAPAPVAALFAIMTKVGAYAILRVHTTRLRAGQPRDRGSGRHVAVPGGHRHDRRGRVRRARARGA